MSTKVLIAQQILYRLAGGIPDSSFPVQESDVTKALEQKINALFKLRHFDTTLPSGETIPDNHMIATYENNAVVSYGLKSKTSLPVTPISLPKGMGIFLVYDPSNPDVPFIPAQRGQTALLRTDALLNDLIGQISYELTNDKLIFNRDLIDLGVPFVTIEMIIMDLSKYSDTQPLPLTADMEAQLVTELTAEFSPIKPETGIVNPYTTAGQNENK